MQALIADDDEHIRALLAAFVAQRGHGVLEAADGIAAWAAWEREQPTLVILDWSMPGIDGLEVCRRIRRADATRSSFVIVVTAHDQSEALEAVLAAGADDFVGKPVVPHIFTARLAIAEWRIALDAGRRAVEAALANAQRLAAIGETALAVQHEINNPLAALMGNAELLLLDPLPPEQQEQARVIVEQSKRIAAVVRRLSAVSGVGSVEYLKGARMLDLADKKPV